MNLLNAIFSNYFIVIGIAIVIFVIIGNIISSILKKGGEAAVDGSVSLVKSSVSGIKYIFSLIFSLISLIFHLIALIFTYFFTKR